MSSVEYSTHQLSVQDIINRHRDRQLDLNPGFQRDSVWGLSDRRKLINSILCNYPLPSIFLYKSIKENGETVYRVIDGKQRIESILMFAGVIRGNRFTAPLPLPESEKGREELIDMVALRRRKLQHVLLNYKLQVIEVTGHLADVIRLFVRINSTGKALTSQEQRKAQFYDSAFLKKADQLAKRHAAFFREAGILSASQMTRMKHIELICELMVAAHTEDVTNKKTALDKVMDSNALTGQRLEKAAQVITTALNRLKWMFPNLKQTRFRQVSDFYSLAVLTQKFERERLILTDRKRNKLASDLLAAFSNGVDEVILLQKQAKGVKPHQEMYREYLLTVREGTDEINHRRKREQILRGLLGTLFERRDAARLFSQEQRRILWNTVDARRCAECRRTLTWEDFTIDHINPYSNGGRTALDNAALMCLKHNSAKGNRRAVSR